MIPKIRRANKTDLQTILTWLESDASGGSFRGNLKFIINNGQEEQCLVLLDPNTREPIAFQYGGLLSPGILEVRKDKRCNGYGKLLVKYCIERAKKKDVAALHIQCKPSSSIPFWEKMGFELCRERFNDNCVQSFNHAFQPIEKHNELPRSGKPVNVTISFGCSFDLKCKNTFSPKAVLYHNKVILESRVIGFKWPGKCIYVCIEINGRSIIQNRQGKAKWFEQLGVISQPNCYYLDEILVPTAILKILNKKQECSFEPSCR